MIESHLDISIKCVNYTQGTFQLIVKFITTKLCIYIHMKVKEAFRKCGEKTFVESAQNLFNPESEWLPYSLIYEEGSCSYYRNIIIG